MTRLRATIERVFEDLSALENPWAVVGGLAVSTYTEPRATRDLDVVMAVSDDDEAERIVWSLLQLGYTVVAAVEQTERGRLASTVVEGQGGYGLTPYDFAGGGGLVENHSEAMHLSRLGS